MAEVPIITKEELVERIISKLESSPEKPGYSHFDLAPVPADPAPYVLILGAGFSHGIVPLVDELMKQTIGGYYYPDQDQSSMERTTNVLRKNSKGFWKEFNNTAAQENLPIVDLGRDGLPIKPDEAYQYLFTFKGANAMFKDSQDDSYQKSYIERPKEERESVKELKDHEIKKPDKGERFVKGFLRYILDQGAEHGYGSVGRMRLNPAHIYLASLLEAQQLGRGLTTSAFCRTILTTNFDTLLQNSLQMVNILYRLTDRPERGMDIMDFQDEEGPIHLVYVHGSILRYNPASSLDDIDGLTQKNIEVLRSFLETRDIIIIGYSGWKDGLMKALYTCDSSKHKVYWCDILPKPSEHIENFIRSHGESASYINLGGGGANDLMRILYESIVSAKYHQDTNNRYREWTDYVWNRNQRD